MEVRSFSVNCPVSLSNGGTFISTPGSKISSIRKPLSAMIPGADPGISKGGCTIRDIHVLHHTECPSLEGGSKFGMVTQSETCSYCAKHNQHA